MRQLSEGDMMNINMQMELFLRRFLLLVMVCVGPSLLSVVLKVHDLTIEVAAETYSQQLEKHSFKSYQRESERGTYAYYKSIAKNIHKPAFLQQVDTLFEMAQKDDDVRLMCMAKCLNFMYYQQNTALIDSVPHYVRESMQFAKSVGSDKYYFHSWKKLINHMLKYYDDDLEVLGEIKRFQKAALEENYSPAVVASYRALSDFYYIKKMFDQCDQILAEAIDYINNHPSDDYFNTSLVYLSAAKLKYKLGHVEEAMLLAKQSEEKCETSRQLLEVYRFYFDNYLELKRYDKAKSVLDTVYTIKGVDTLNKVVRTMKHNWWKYTLRRDGKWRQYIHVIRNELASFPLYSKSDIYLDLAVAYAHNATVDSVEWALGNSLALRDSLTRKDSYESYAFYTTQMQLENYKASQQRLHNKHVVQLAWILGIALIILSGLLLWNLRTIRELKRVNTRLIETQDELQEAKSKADLLNHMKNSFLHNVSHEVRTPLNSIVGFSSIIAEMYQEDPEVHEYVQVINQNSNKLIKLIEDMLLISCLDEEESQLDINTVSLMKLCDEAMQYAKKRSLNPQIPIVFNSENFSDIQIWTNDIAVQQVLSNLLHNGNKFTTQGQVTLRLLLSNDNRHVTFEITDTGCGVPKEHMDKIFHRFRQVDNYSNGFGLGLAICRIISHRLGGDIWIDKEYAEQGSRFCFKIPVYERPTICANK